MYQKVPDSTLCPSEKVTLLSYVSFVFLHSRERIYAEFWLTGKRCPKFIFVIWCLGDNLGGKVGVVRSEWPPFVNSRGCAAKLFVHLFQVWVIGQLLFCTVLLAASVWEALSSDIR